MTDLTPTDKRVLAALNAGPAGPFKLAKRTRRPTRSVRESLARLEDRDLVALVGVGPHGGPYYERTDTDA